MERIRGLDAIRAVCAMWVVLSHFAPPPPAEIDKSNVAGRLIAGLYSHFFNGPAAVIAFFVISGFCIHYPFAGSMRFLSLKAYFARRYLRIGIPLAVAVAVAPSLGIPFDLFHNIILWSLAAELIYYTLYPLILAFRRYGVAWLWLWAVSMMASWVVASTNPSVKHYPSWGPGLDWLLCLPCWLAGCWLAERVAQNRLPELASIWWWRLSVWSASVALSIFRHHSPIGYPFTPGFFAVLVALWLSQEVRRYRLKALPGWLEWAGKWSYSLYLIHVPAHAILVSIAFPSFGPFLNWLMLISFILTMSYLFSVCVEYPAHIAARTIGRALSPHSRPPTVPQ